jgi:DNA-binding GntR family transcriptional regulator
MKKTPVRSNNALSERVYRALYRQIVTGRLKPGQRITELQIAESQGVSQAPVREALKRLAEDRLVELVPRSGCYVTKLTREDAGYLFDIRKRLETLAMEHAFRRLDLARVGDLREKFVQCLELDDARLVQRELKFDEELHTLIYETSGSRDLQSILSKLRARVQLFRIREATDITRAKFALNRHIEILDAVLAGDRRKAVQLVGRHIEDARENVLKNFVDDET